MDRRRPGHERANVFIGFPLGGLLSLAIAAPTAIVLPPQGIGRRQPDQVGAPGAWPRSARIGLAFVILGFFAATFGAALETGLSAGYTVAAVLRLAVGEVRPAEARGPVPHRRAMLERGRRRVLLTAVDPIKVTEYSLVFRGWPCR